MPARLLSMTWGRCAPHKRALPSRERAASALGGSKVTGKSAEWIVERTEVKGAFATLPEYVTDSWWSTNARDLGSVFHYPGEPGNATADQITMLGDNGANESFVNLVGPNAVLRRKARQPSSGKGWRRRLSAGGRSPALLIDRRGPLAWSPDGGGEPIFRYFTLYLLKGKSHVEGEDAIWRGSNFSSIVWSDFQAVGC